MLQVVCETSPEHFHLRLCQAPRVELPQPQLALDPCVTKLHDSSTATVFLLGFFTSHLLAERDHHRAFFELRYRTAVPFVVWTTLRFASADLAILKPGFIDVVNHPRPHLALSLPSQDFALRTNTAIPLRLIEECARRKLVRQVGSAWCIPHGPEKIDLSFRHLLDILSRGVATIGHHLLGSFIQPL